MAKRSCYLDGAALETAVRAGDDNALAPMLYTLFDHVIRTRQADLPPGLDVDDVRQVAVLDALRRLKRWEPGRSSAFSYATGSVQFSIMAEIKSRRLWEARFGRLMLEVGEDAVPC